MPYSNTNIFSRKNKICLLNFQLNIEQLLHLIGNIIRNKKYNKKIERSGHITTTTTTATTEKNYKQVLNYKQDL